MGRMIEKKSNSRIDGLMFGALCLVALTTLSFVGLSSPFAGANGVVVEGDGSSPIVNSAAASVIVASACTFTSTVDTAHTASVSASSYVANIGLTTFSTVCNDAGGYAVYAVGYTDSTIGNNVLAANIGGVVSPTDNIATGTAESGNTSNWAMKLNSVTNAGLAPIITGEAVGDTEDFTDYHNVPATYTKVAQLSSSTGVVAPSSFQATYAAYVAGDQPAGIYSGKVKYTLVHPATAVPNEPKSCSNNKICYWPNGNGFVTDTMGDQTYAKGNSGTRVGPSVEVTLWPTNFKRPGYGFAGWSDKFDWILNENDANGNGTGANAGYHIYGPMQDITTPSDMSKGLSLYAVWVKSAEYIQDWTCPNDTAMPIGTVTALTDQRDNDTYAVAKLADSNCWMIENLRLDYDAEHNADGSLAQGYGTSTTYGNFIGLAEPETANFSNSTTANSLYKSDGSGDIKGINGATLTDIGTTNNPASRFPRYNNNNTNPTATTANPNTTVANMTRTNQNIYSYGNYYTWAAAMANTNYYNTTTVDANGYTPSEAAGTSICPKGWKLPYGRSTGKGASSGGFSYLDTQLGGTGASSSSSTTPTGAEMSKAWRSFPNNILYSGNFITASANDRGSSGRYWSSTAYSNGNSYYLYLFSSNVLPGTGDYTKYSGFPTRCMVGS